MDLLRSLTAEDEDEDHHHHSLESLQTICNEGKLRGKTTVRSIVWRIVLRLLPLNRREWIHTLRQTRTAYVALRERTIVEEPSQLCTDPTTDNPLAQNDENPYMQFFSGKELRAVIKLDVERTEPDIDFFRTKVAHTMLSDILFCYGRENPDIAYRQGMSDILGRLLQVLLSDQQAYSLLKEEGKLEAEGFSTDAIELLDNVFDQNFLEHDSYTLFNQVMSHIKYSYEFETETSKTPSYLRPQKPEVKWLGGEPFLSEQLDDDEIHRLNYCADHKSQLIRRLYHIQDVLLKEVDPQLYAHFTEIKFTPADYGYGMVFPSPKEFLFIWDVIFASEPMFSIIDQMYLALVIRMRDYLLQKDAYSCFLRLLAQTRSRRPPNVNTFVQLSLHLKSPEKYPRPENIDERYYPQNANANEERRSYLSDDLLLEDTPKISKISLKQTGIDGGKKGEEKAPKLDDSSKKASLAECIGFPSAGPLSPPYRRQTYSGDSGGTDSYLSAREINRFGQQSSTTAEKNKETTKAKGASSKAKISGSRKDENFGRELDLKTQQYPAEIELMKEQISLLQERLNNQDFTCQRISRRIYEVSKELAVLNPTTKKISSVIADLRQLAGQLLTEHQRSPEVSTTTGKKVVTSSARNELNDDSNSQK